MQGSSAGCLSHLNHAHGVGVTRAGTPASQDDDNVALLEETSGLAHFHCEIDSHIDILCPNIMRGLGVQDREDPTVEVGLASRLGVTGHGEDGSTGPVPGEQVGRPADRHTPG